MKTCLTFRVGRVLSLGFLPAAARGWLGILGVLVLAGLAQPALARRAVTPDAAREGPKEWPTSTNRHKVSIVRKAADQAELELIARAEGVQPDRATPAKVPGEGGAWWCQEQLGVRIPYAVTGDAVTYYTGLVTGYSKMRMKRYAEPSSSLAYTASVVRHERFELDGKAWRDVRVVSMKLEFRQSFCASATEAFGFTKERTVVFDADGKVVHVSGDGPTDVPVMAI